jgi:predicted nucleic acid-binding protein
MVAFGLRTLIGRGLFSSTPLMNFSTRGGPILAEVLCGFRRDAQADWVASARRGLHYLELTWDDWRATARLSRQLAARGHQLPLSDLALAAVALRCDCAVFTSDPRFDLIPNLQRFEMA